MKKFTAMVLVITVFSVFAFPVNVYAAGYWTDGVTFDAASTFNGGTGDVDTPYLITTAESLAQLAVNVNDDTAPVD